MYNTYRYVYMYLVCNIYNVQCTCTVYNVHCILYTVHVCVPN